MKFCKELNKHLQKGQLTGFLTGQEGTLDYNILFTIIESIMEDTDFEKTNKGLNRKLLYHIIRFFKDRFQKHRVRELLGWLAEGEVAKLKTINQLILFLKTIDNVEELIKGLYVKPSYQGFLYERIWDIIIKFGCCEKFPNNEYNHLDGNAGTPDSMKIIDDMKRYSEGGIQSGNSGGVSDITLRRKDNGSWVFISVKHYKKERGVQEYGLDELKGKINDHYGGIENCDIYFIVKDKKGFLQKVLNANRSNIDMTRHMTEDKILDLKDLQKYFIVWKNMINQYPDRLNWDKDILNIERPPLILKFHQQLIVDNTIEAIHANIILWGCKPRSGKTYMAGGYIERIRARLKKDFINVLVITPAPTETLSQWTDDLFGKYQNFNNRLYDKFDVQGNGSKLLRHKFNRNINNIIILSKQMLQINEDYLHKLPALDLIIFDEVHFGGTTPISESLIRTISKKDTLRLFLTATWQKPVWTYKPDYTQFWDLEDEHLCKTGNIELLVKKHGVNVRRIFNDMYVGRIEELKKDYEKYPELSIISSIWDIDKIKYSYEHDIEFDSPDIKRGFCMETLFSVKDTGTFKFPSVVGDFTRYIEKVVYKHKINKIADNPFNTTHIWFLPRNNIRHISKSLEEILLSNNFFNKHFGIMSIYSDVKRDLGDIKKVIKRKEDYLITQNKGLIILAGGMLNLGITLNRCNVVCLFNNTTSSDTIIQQMFRCMTEVEGKTRGVVVDLDNNRVLNTMITIADKVKGDTLQKIRYLIEHNIIWVDEDHFNAKDNDNPEIINKIVKAWERVLQTRDEYTVNALTKEFENAYIKLSEDDQDFLDELVIHRKAGYKGHKIGMTEDEKEDIPSGISKIKVKKDKQSFLKPQKELHVNFTKDIATPVLKLITVLFFRDDESFDIKNIIHKTNNEYREVIIKYIQDILQLDKKNSVRIFKIFIDIFKEC